MDIDSLGIYDGLDEFQEKEEKKSAELLALETKYQEALETIENMKLEKKAIRKQLRTMEMNFQILIDTARTEIRRKDAKIADLQREKDEICFRRRNAVVERASMDTDYFSSGYQNRYERNPFKESATVSNEIVCTADDATLSEVTITASEDNRYSIEGHVWHFSNVRKQNDDLHPENSLGDKKLSTAVEKMLPEKVEELVNCDKRRRSNNTEDDDVGQAQKRRKVYYKPQNLEEAPTKERVRSGEDYHSNDEQIRKRGMSYEEYASHHLDERRRSCHIGEHESEEKRFRNRNIQSHKDYNNYRSNHHIDFDKYGRQNETVESSSYYRHSHSSTSRRETERHRHRYERDRERFSSRHESRKDYTNRKEYRRHEEPLIDVKVQENDYCKRSEKERESAKESYKTFERSSHTTKYSSNMRSDVPVKDGGFVEKQRKNSLEIETKKTASKMKETEADAENLTEKPEGILTQGTKNAIETILRTPPHKSIPENISCITLSSDSNKSRDVATKALRLENESTERRKGHEIEPKTPLENDVLTLITPKKLELLHALFGPSPSFQKTQENSSVSKKMLETLNCNNGSPATSPSAFSDINEMDKSKAQDVFHENNERSKETENQKAITDSSKTSAGSIAEEVESYFVRIETKNEEKENGLIGINESTKADTVYVANSKVENCGKESEGLRAEILAKENAIIEIDDDITPAHTDDEDTIVFENVEPTHDDIPEKTTSEPSMVGDKGDEMAACKIKKHIEIIEDIRLPPVLPIKEILQAQMEHFPRNENTEGMAQEISLKELMANNILKDSQNIEEKGKGETEEKNEEEETKKKIFEGEPQEEESDLEGKHLYASNRLKDVKKMVEEELNGQMDMMDTVEHNNHFKNEDIKESVLNCAQNPRQEKKMAFEENSLKETKSKECSSKNKNKSDDIAQAKNKRVSKEDNGKNVMISEIVGPTQLSSLNVEKDKPNEIEDTNDHHNEFDRNAINLHSLEDKTIQMTSVEHNFSKMEKTDTSDISECSKIAIDDNMTKSNREADRNNDNCNIETQDQINNDVNRIVINDNNLMPTHNETKDDAGIQLKMNSSIEQLQDNQSLECLENSKDEHDIKKENVLSINLKCPAENSKKVKENNSKKYNKKEDKYDKNEKINEDLNNPVAIDNNSQQGMLDNIIQNENVKKQEESQNEDNICQPLTTENNNDNIALEKLSRGDEELSSFQQHNAVDDFNNKKLENVSDLNKTNVAERLTVNDSKIEGITVPEKFTLISNSNDNEIEEGNCIENALASETPPEENKIKHNKPTLQSLTDSEDNHKMPNERRRPSYEEKNEATKNLSNEKSDDCAKDKEELQGVTKTPSSNRKVSISDNDEVKRTTGKTTKEQTKHAKEDSTKEVMQKKPKEVTEVKLGEKKPRKKRKDSCVTDSVVDKDSNSDVSKINFEDGKHENEVVDKFNKKNSSIQKSKSSRSNKLKPITIKLDSTLKRSKGKARKLHRIYDSPSSDDEIPEFDDNVTSRNLGNTNTIIDPKQSNDICFSPTKLIAETHQKSQDNIAIRATVSSQDQQTISVTPTTATTTTEENQGVIASTTPDHQIFHCEPTGADTDLSVLPIFNVTHQDKQYRDIDSRLQSMFQSPPQIETHQKDAMIPTHLRNQQYSPSQLAIQSSPTESTVSHLANQTITNATELNLSFSESSLADTSQLNLSSSLAADSTFSTTPTTSATLSNASTTSSTFYTTSTTNSTTTTTTTTTPASTLNHSINSDLNLSLETKCVSLGNSQYRIEKVSENVSKVFITRKRHKRK